VACTIDDRDTATMTLMRLFLFYIVVGNAFKELGHFYGSPVLDLQSQIKFRPQVKLVFKETRNEQNKTKTNLATREITFRLMNETSETISRAKAAEIAKDIKREFQIPFIWQKGKYKCTYKDEEKEYDLRLLVNSKNEGAEVVKKVLSINSHTFDDDYFQFIENTRTYPANPGTHRVYGRTVQKPQLRPSAALKFHYAQLLIWGQQNAVNLVAGPGRFKSVIERL
jgi:hypothetical protein